MPSDNYQKIIAKKLGIKLIAYNPVLSNALGSVKAGLFLGQLLFWYGKGSNPEWTYKTANEIERETGLSRNEQETAIKICKRFKLIDVKLKGIPATRNFKVNVEKIKELLESRLLKDSKQDYKIKEKKFADFGETNTENTTESSTKKTNKEDPLYKRSKSSICPLSSFDFEDIFSPARRKREKSEEFSSIKEIIHEKSKYNNL